MHLKQKVTLTLTNKTAVRTAIAIFALLFILLISPLRTQMDYFVKGGISYLTGTIRPDSNVVVITISSDEVEQLGGWPLKRSYYALLINKLRGLGVKKIGLEIFLSSSNSIQSVYDDLLVEEIRNSRNVVLASLAFETLSGKDSVAYPQPKIKDSNIKSGHINYRLSEDIEIPRLWNEEKSFSSVITSSSIEEPYSINVFSSWKSFYSINALEFLKLADDNNARLKRLSGKYVVIGVTDPSLAKTIKTNYEDDLPGVGIHAFAIDNLLNNRTVDHFANYVATAAFVFLLTTLFFAENRLKFYYRYLLFVVVVSVLSALMYRLFFIEVYGSFWIFPMILFFVYDVYLAFSEKEETLKSSFDENTFLRNMLKSKEQKLAELEEKIENANKVSDERLSKEISDLKEEILSLKQNENTHEEIAYEISDAKNFEGIIYRSEKIQKLVTLIEKIAPHDATVLIQGESGSGKELIARAIHSLSNRKEKNFVALNCAAIPETLLESELFGHVKGAFTNAVGDKKGKFELADGGTLFMDEIGETSEAFQTKLLRAIQFGEFYKVGSTQSQKVNVRILAASNKNLEKAVKEGLFREDLFYRLNVLKLELPPLRERKEDIEVLADHFCRRDNNNIKLSKIVVDSLIKNEWKGNVRELESVITHSLIMAKSEKRDVIKLSDIPEPYRKYAKHDLESMVLQSVRAKEFSYSSLNETAKELGGLNRTVVSETLRGIFLKTLVENAFNKEETVKCIAANQNKTVIEKVQAKLSVYIENIDSGLANQKGKVFEEVKNAFSSKYKNLPGKYHTYLDEVIRARMEGVKK